MREKKQSRHTKSINKNKTQRQKKKNLKSHIWVLFSLPNTRNDHFFFIACGSIYRTDFVFFLCRFCFFFGLWFNILTFFVIVIIYMHAWVCMFFFCYEKKLYVQKKLRSIEMGRNKKKNCVCNSFCFDRESTRINVTCVQFIGMHATLIFFSFPLFDFFGRSSQFFISYLTHAPFVFQ